MSIYTVNDNTVNSGALTLTEQEIYGSSRVGMVKPALNLSSYTTPTRINMSSLGSVGYYTTFTRGKKFFELDNHLGNVLVTVSDKKFGVSSNNSGIVNYYTPDIVSAQDYYPFGMQMPGRHTIYKSSYRFGFNGKEQDPETYGQGNEYDYGMRIYNPRIGKFLSVDPLARGFAWNSPYSYAEGDVVRSIDPDGLEKITVTNNSFAPFDWFGQDAQGQYKGDGEKRKYGDKGTYRLSGSILLNLGTSSQIALTAGKTQSTYQLYYSTTPFRVKTSLTNNEYSFYGDPLAYSSHVDMHIYGHDEAATSNYFKIPSFFVPNIDVTMNISFQQTSKNSYMVTGNVRGDRFPADETYITDQSGQILFLGVSGPGTDKMTGPYEFL